MPNDFHPGNPVNNATEKNPRNSSHFSLNRCILGTERFGEYTPFLSLECVPDDRNGKFISEHDLRSYTLKSPLMQDISLQKEFAFIPAMALLPFNWDLIYTNPTQGDDVPQDANTVVKQMRYEVSMLCRAFIILHNNLVNTPPTIVTSAVKGYLNSLFLVESFVSTGSLYSCLNCHFDSIWHNFDDTFDSILTHFLTACDVNIIPLLTSDGSNLDINYRYPDKPDYRDVHEVLDLLRRGDAYFNFDDEELLWDEFLGDLISGTDVKFNDTPDTDDTNINIAPFWSYQLFCYHNFSNDHIDYIYSSELFRSLVSYYITQMSYDDTFTYNGIALKYDYLSGHYTYMFLEDAINKMVNNSVDDEIFAYFRLLNSFNRSLRYEDYFVGAKSQPLAVGDVNVQVNSNLVSIVDTTRKIQLQRFLNAVNRTGRKISNYVKSLFGVDVAPDYHNPIWLARTTDKVYSPEIENTASDQLTKSQTITSNFRSSGGNYQFEMEVCDKVGYIIGVRYYDIKRVYDSGIERIYYHTDRFELFNPFMQFIGDQEINVTELDASQHNEPISYTLRHMEYKQLASYAFGGFCRDYIDGFGFSFVPYKNNAQHPFKIGPDFIRAKSSELDKYYTSLPGLFLGRYFHFIVKTDNNYEVDRPMVYAPSIL